MIYTITQYVGLSANGNVINTAERNIGSAVSIEGEFNLVIDAPSLRTPNRYRCAARGALPNVFRSAEVVMLGYKLLVI